MTCVGPGGVASLSTGYVSGTTYKTFYISRLADSNSNTLVTLFHRQKKHERLKSLRLMPSHLDTKSKSFTHVTCARLLPPPHTLFPTLLSVQLHWHHC